MVLLVHGARCQSVLHAAAAAIGNIAGDGAVGDRDGATVVEHATAVVATEMSARSRLELPAMVLLQHGERAAVVRHATAMR